MLLGNWNSETGVRKLDTWSSEFGNVETSVRKLILWKLETWCSETGKVVRNVELGSSRGWAQKLETVGSEKGKVGCANSKSTSEPRPSASLPRSIHGYKKFIDARPGDPF